MVFEEIQASYRDKKISKVLSMCENKVSNNTASELLPILIYNTNLVKQLGKRCNLKGLAQAKIIKKSAILFWVLNMTI